MADEETATPEKTCQMALEAAAEKGLSYCDTEDALHAAMAEQFGLDAEVDDPDAILLDGPDGAEPEEWVLCRSVDLIQEEEMNPVGAVNQAWGEVSLDVSEEGGATDDDEESTDEDESLDEEAEGGETDALDDDIEEVAADS